MGPTLVYFAADADRNVWIQTTKDLDVARLVDEDTLRRQLDIVRIEEFATMKEALTRLKRIRKMAVPRRLRLIERDNPAWKDVAVIRGYVPRRIDPEDVRRAKASSVPWRASGRDDDDTSDGVSANLTTPPVPRKGKDAKPFPPQPS